MTQNYDLTAGMCKPVLEAELHFGKGNREAGKQRIAGFAQDGEHDSRVMYDLSKHCENDATIIAWINEISQDISYGIYSIGTYSFDGQTCKGYLTETKGTTSKGRTVGYNLIGMGDCKNQKVDKDVFHPVNNPKGVPAGDFYKNTLAYDGEIPINWLFNGQVYPFSTPVAQTVSASLTPTLEKSTETVAGKFVIKIYNDITTPQQVFLNNKIIEKCGNRACNEFFSIEVNKAFDVDGKSVLLIEYSDGGTACGVLYGFFTINKDGTYESTDSNLGNCSDVALGSIVQSGSKLILSLPTQDQNTPRSEVWTYENGQVTAPIKDAKP